MSFFKTQGIVLKIIKVSQGEMIYRILFRDYGILSVSKKKKVKEKPIDIGYLISCEIITKKYRDIHTVGNIKILSYFKPSEKPYLDVESFLYILSRIHKEVPEWNPHYEIYDILSHCINVEWELNSSKILLTHLKIISVLWNLQELHKDTTCEKTLKFIHKYSYKKILELRDIPQDTKKHLEQML